MNNDDSTVVSNSLHVSHLDHLFLTECIILCLKKKEIIWCKDIIELHFTHYEITIIVKSREWWNFNCLFILHDFYFKTIIINYKICNCMLLNCIKIIWHHYELIMNNFLSTWIHIHPNLWYFVSFCEICMHMEMW